MAKTDGQRVETNELPAIDRISVAGFKSFRREQTISIAPLTILAGANSSGKSSAMQPLLLLKQTLEATYDPGVLMLNGPNVKFTSADQLLWRGTKGEPVSGFSVGIKAGTKGFKVFFYRDQGKRLDLKKIEYEIPAESMTLVPSMSSDQIMSLPQFESRARRLMERYGLKSVEARTVRERFFLNLERVENFDAQKGILRHTYSRYFEPLISGLIHLPGLRGNPERNYPVTAVGDMFPGLFDKYVASIIAQWGADLNQEKLVEVGDDLAALGLTWKVSATPLNDTQVELKVGRLPRAARGGARDLVSIADVGVGVSQTLPVVVALLAAEPGQLVFIEQPEIHLHPRAQVAMAGLLANAAKRGVRVVIETHSSLLILGVQTLVAKGQLDPALVKLHWFERNPDHGETTVRSAEVDEAGAFGDWPEDFADVSLQAEHAFLSAAEARLARK